MITVTDCNGEEHNYDDGESFETEDIHNNLAITTPTRFAVFAEGKWHKVEQENPDGAISAG